MVKRWRKLSYGVSLPVLSSFASCFRYDSSLRFALLAPSVRHVRLVPVLSLLANLPTVLSARLRSVRLVPVLSLLAILPTVLSARLRSPCFVFVCFLCFPVPRCNIIDFPEL